MKNLKGRALTLENTWSSDPGTPAIDLSRPDFYHQMSRQGTLIKYKNIDGVEVFALVLVEYPTVKSFSHGARKHIFSLSVLRSALDFVQVSTLRGYQATREDVRDFFVEDYYSE